MSEERKKTEENKPDMMEQEMKDFNVRGSAHGHNLPWWKEIAQILRKNTKSLVIVVLAAVVRLGAGVFLGAMIGRGNTADETASAETQTAEAESRTEENDVAYVPLEENAYPKLNALIDRNIQPAAEGVMVRNNPTKDNSERKELLKIQERSNNVRA